MTTSFTPAPFDGRRFHNLSGRPPQRPGDVLRWLARRHPEPWPRDVPARLGDRPAPNVDDGSVRATLVGHSTVLLQTAGLNLLTDPVWSQRIGPVPLFGIRRVCAPALALSELPRIDAVLLSHNHYDHLDRPTLAALARRHQPRVFAGLRVGSSLPHSRVIELDWWQSHTLTQGVRVTYVPAEHASARGLFDRNRTLWGGFVLETPAATVYFAGDTADGEHFAAMRERFGPMTLSLLPIAAYAPRSIMQCVHMDPGEAVRASLRLESQVSLAIHHSTFALADDGFAEGPRELARALAEAHEGGPGMDFRVVPFGAPLDVRRRALPAARAAHS